MGNKVEVKARKTGTQVQCPKCESESVWCGYYNRRTLFSCAKCSHSWGYGPEQCSIRQVRVTSESHVLNVFHGSWLPEEVTKVENSFRKIILDSEGTYRDEWSFFKGRQLYSAWRLNDVGGVLMTAGSLLALIDKAIVRCRQSQNL